MDEQNQSLRTNIALVLIILMTVGFMWWSGGFSPSKPEAETDGGAAAAAVIAAAGANPVQVVMNATGVSDAGAVEVADGGALAQAAEPPPPTLKIERDRTTAHYQFWSEGGGLASA